MSKNQLIIEKVSPYNVADTVEKLIKAALQKGWQCPAVHNLQQSLAKSGKTVLPVEVVELCKPEYSGRMLEQDDGRVISILMPYRISIYEEADGKTYVALLNMSVMTAGLPTVAAEAINSASEEALGIVESIIGPFGG
jgi:uncharacterized protein (DUF302 family)